MITVLTTVYIVVIKRDNKFARRKLTMEEVAEEVRILERMGHKRLALELGEDPVNAPIEYALECLNTIYKTQNANGEIRRVNVNIAATTVENYKKIKNQKRNRYIYIIPRNISSRFL